MPQGQQRRNNARGRIPSSDLPRLDMQWEVTARDLFSVTIAPLDGMEGVIVSGILRAVIVETGEVAISTSIQALGIFMAFASVPAGESTIRIESNDPAVRNSHGGYLVGADAPVNPPTPQPPSAELTGDAYANAVMNLGPTVDNVTLEILLQTPHTHEFYIGVTRAFSNIAVQVQSIGFLFSASTNELWQVKWDGTAWVGTQLI
jgi:hypothetical protein